MPRLPAAGCPHVTSLVPSAFLMFLKKKLGFFCHVQMKTNLEMPIFFCARNPLFPAIPLAVCSVLNRGNVGDAALTLPIAYGRAGYHCG